MIETIITFEETDRQTNTIESQWHIPYLIDVTHIIIYR